MDTNKQEALRQYHEALTARRQLAEIRQQMQAQDAVIEKAKTDAKHADWLIYGLGLVLLGMALFDVQKSALEWLYVGLAGVGVIANRLFRALQLDADRREQARLASTGNLIKAAHPSLSDQFSIVNEGAHPTEDEARKIIEWISRSLPQT